MVRYVFATFCVIVLHIHSPAQIKYPTDYFDSPIRSEIYLAGNFGEIRPNHFHSGIDIKTNGKQGIPIYAIADGVVSRINISPFGYGKALYINHVNGYTSVYGHLKSFNEGMDAFAKKNQYKKESFVIDTLLSSEFNVKKGDIIGFSGNTGYSEAPHLHFEIRNTTTELPINPMLFGFKVKDTIAPKIVSLTIYPITTSSYINEQQNKVKLKAISGSEYYHINLNNTITVSGEIGFGIECYDTENGNNQPHAIYSIELLSGGKRIYYADFEKFSFENSRYVNTYMDYAEKVKNNVKIQKCFLSKNNQLGIYKGVINNGIINFNDTLNHWIRIIVKDYAGNVSTLTFKVKGIKKNNVVFKNDVASVIDCLTNSEYKDETIQLSIPAYSLYDDIQLKIKQSKSLSGCYSPVYRIQDEETALQQNYTLTIKAVNIPNTLQNKAGIASINKNKKIEFQGGTYVNGWVSTSTKIVGNFVIMVDTTGPIVKPTFKIKTNHLVNFANETEIKFIISDNLSGINTYRGTIDDKWVLCEYDAKANSLFYTFDKQPLSGKHLFKLEVSDKKNNSTFLEFAFIK